HQDHAPAHTSPLSLHDALPIYVNELSAVVKEAYRNGYEGKIYAYGNAAGSNGQFVANVGKELAEGVHHTQHVPVDDSEAYSIYRSEEHTSEFQSRENLVCRLLL